MTHTVAIPTRNRTGALVRCLDSLKANAEMYGRDVRVVVADDSNESFVPSNRAALAACGLPFEHFDRGLRERFALDLAAAAGVPPEAAVFAVLPGASPDMGAVRNFLVLKLAGRKFVMLDDDMVCKFAAAPGGRKTRWSLGPFVTSQDVRPLDGLARECQMVDVDFLGGLTGRLGEDGVVAAVGGSVGDSGAGNSWWCMVDPDFLEQVKGSTDGLRRALLYRQVMRSTAAPTVVNWPSLVTMNMALDAGSPIPPFLPLARGEDTLFGIMLRQFSAARTLYCDHAMWHTARRESSPEEELRAISTPLLAEFLLSTIVLWNPPTAQAYAAKLRQYAVAPDFQRLVDWVVDKRQASLRGRAAALMELDLPDFVLREVGRVREVLRRDGPYAPPDIGGLDFRAVLLQFADLLSAWPRLLGAAKGANA